MRIVDQVLQTLNSAAQLDPGAFAALIGHRVLCSASLADHPTVVVGNVNDDPEGPPEVGMMGVINSIVEELSVQHGEGRQRIAYRIFDSDWAKNGKPLLDLKFVPYCWPGAEQGVELNQKEMAVLREIMWQVRHDNSPLPWKFAVEFGYGSSIWPEEWRIPAGSNEQRECARKLIRMGVFIPYNYTDPIAETIQLNSDELAVVQCLLSGVDQDGEGLPDLPLNDHQFIRVCPDEWEGPAAEHPEREACKAKLIRMGLVVET